MKLDNVGERYQVIDKLIKKSFKLDAMWVYDQENTDDWACNMEIMTNLMAINDLIYTEKIFLDAFDKAVEVRSRYFDEKNVYLNIFFETIRHFIDEILLSLIESFFDDLHDWKFKTEIGQKFHKDVSKKLDALIKKYQDIYDL